MEVIRTTARPEPQRWTGVMCKPAGNSVLEVYTEEFRAARDSETEWIAIEDVPELSFEQGKDIGVNEAVCPLCNDTRCLRLMFRGTHTEIEMQRQVECPCRFQRMFWYRFKLVGERFHGVTLAGLKPSEKVRISHERQTEIISQLQAAPTDSYLLVGEPGLGKTHLMVSLFERAVTDSITEPQRGRLAVQSVWWASTSVLLNQHTAKETEREGGLEIPVPHVTEKKIRLAVDHGWRPKLFLDEIDKIAVTDFKLRRLGELVNAVYLASGQIVATCNKGPAELANTWRDSDEAGTILRRISSDGGHLIPVR